MSKQLISTFFTDNSIDNWNFNNFCSFFYTKKPNASKSEALFKYKNDLEYICRSKLMNQALRARAGQLLNEMKKNKRKTNKDEPIITFNNQGSAFNNNGIVNGDVIVGSSKADVVKKQKFNHVEDANSWQVENEEDLWDAWRQFMDCCSCHDFCPEKYHIIECGYSIQCKPNIPQQLYDHLDVNAETIKNPFKQHVKYSFTVLDTLKNLPEKWKEARKLLFLMAMKMTMTMKT